jgi:hypothetical protein
MYAGPPQWSRGPRDTRDLSEQERRDLSEQERIEQDRRENAKLREQEISQLKNTTPNLSGLSEQELSQLNKPTPQSVFYLVAWIIGCIIVFLLLFGGLVLLSVFHVR